MPSAPYKSRAFLFAATLSLALLTSGCGGGDKAGSGTDVQMKDLETVDGTINDAMTDLDGVQSEGTALTDTGSNVTSAPKTTGAAADNATPAPEAKSDDTEVVADQ